MTVDTIKSTNHIAYHNTCSESSVFVLYTLAGPGSVPTNISLSNKSSEHIELTWSPPELKYGEIIFYNLSVNFHNGTSNNTIANANCLSISPLDPYQRVTVRISATNSAGQGPYSDPFNVRTNESSKTDR